MEHEIWVTKFCVPEQFNTHVDKSISCLTDVVSHHNQGHLKKKILLGLSISEGEFITIVTWNMATDGHIEFWSST